MPRVIIQPAGSGAQKHFRSTIETPVPIARIRPFVTADKFQQLTQIYGAEGSAPMWGVRPYGERDWSQFQSGDIVAFIGFNRIYKTMRVTTTLRSEDLARQLWGLHDRGDSWEFMFCLNDGRNQRISSQDYCKLMGHRPNYHPVRMTLLTQSRSDQLIPLLNLDDQSQEYSEPVRQTSEADSDRPSLSNSRRQQSLLRDLLQAMGKAIYSAMRKLFK